MRHLLFFFLVSIFFLFSATPILAQGAFNKGECDPRSIKGVPPKDDDLIDPSLCPVDEAACYALKPPAYILYTCYPAPAYPLTFPIQPTPTQGPTPTPDLRVCSKTEEVVVNGKRVPKCTEINTSFGSIQISTTGFVRNLLSLLLGFAGGIALLLIMVSGYQIMMSQGEAEKVKGARETITSAIVGLLFIIFSLVILQIIGVDLLHIPGLSR